MKHIPYVFSLIGYVALSYFYFVEREFILALGLWAGLLLIKVAVKPLREQVPLLLVVGACFAFFNFLHRSTHWVRWPVDFYLTTLLGFVILRFVLRRPVEKLKWSFKFSKWEWLSIFAINIPAVAILIWYYTANPEVADMWPVPNLPLWSIPLVVFGIAAINGLREEIFYRGLLQPASSEKSPVWFVIGLQAVLFGFLHFVNAFPEGWLGVAMTATWGAAIAIQYRFFKSISLSWVTHAVADAVMFSIILLTRS